MASIALGIDIGSSVSYTAYVGKQGNVLVLNEASKRSTASLVSIDSETKTRLIGQASLTKLNRNLTCTARNLKQLIGKPVDATGLKEEYDRWGLCELVQAVDQPGFCGVDLCGQNYTITQVLAMLITRLVRQAEIASEKNIAGVVLSCPSNFADVHRQTLLDACVIAQVRCYRIFNETSAMALAYAYPRRKKDSVDHLPSAADVEAGRDRERMVVFVSLGHSRMQAAVGLFTDMGCRTIADVSTEAVSGRNMDWELMKMMEQRYGNKYGKSFDLLGNSEKDRKAKIKLEAAVAKTKHTLSLKGSSGEQADCIVEYFDGENDLRETVTRQEFEDACEHLKPEVTKLLTELTTRARIHSAKQIDFVEMVGGAQRVPWFSKMIVDIFSVGLGEERKLGYTVDANDCVALGCSYEAALRCDAYRNVAYDFLDCVPRSYGFSWANKKKDSGIKTQMLFKVEDESYPRVRMGAQQPLSFCRQQIFHVDAYYGANSDLPAGAHANFASFRIQIPEYDRKRNVKVRVKVDQNGCFAAEGPAKVVMDDDASQMNDEGKPMMEEHPIIYDMVGKFDYETLQRFQDHENTLRQKEQELIAAHDARNELEKYVLSAQSNFTDENKGYGRPGDLDKFRIILEEAMDWMWKEESRPPTEYEAKVNAIVDVVGATNKRIAEAKQRGDALVGLLSTCEKWTEKIASESMTSQAMQHLDAACRKYSQEVTAAVQQSDAQPKTQDPVIWVADIKARCDDLDRMGSQVDWSGSQTGTRQLDTQYASPY